METKDIVIIILTIAVLGVSITTLILNNMAAESSKSGLNDVKDSINDVKTTLNNSMSSISKNQLAMLEESNSNFDPELQYRLYSISPDAYLPYSLRADVTNMHDEPTFVRHKWTITGNICNANHESQFTTLNFSDRNSASLTSGDREEVSIQLPPELFVKKIPDKTAILVQFELEMNPHIPSIESLKGIEKSKMTYIQYDFKEDTNSWMPTMIPGGELNCTVSPSKSGDVIINTSSIHDFYDHSDWWEFPED